jgi:hypothetical protein
MVRRKMTALVGRALQKEGVDWMWAGWWAGVGFWVKYQAVNGAGTGTLARWGWEMGGGGLALLVRYGRDPEVGSWSSRTFVGLQISRISSFHPISPPLF